MKALRTLDAAIPMRFAVLLCIPQCNCASMKTELLTTSKYGMYKRVVGGICSEYHANIYPSSTNRIRKWQSPKTAASCCAKLVVKDPILPSIHFKVVKVSKHEHGP